MKRIAVIHYGKEPMFNPPGAICMQITKENTIEKLVTVARRMMVDEIVIEDSGDPEKYYFRLWKALRKALSNEKLECHANSIIVQLGRSIESNYEYYNEQFDDWLDYFIGME